MHWIKDNYKEETPKNQVECLPSNATLRMRKSL